MSGRVPVSILVSSALFIAAAAAPAAAQSPGAARADVLQVYQELFAASQKDKRGLTFHVNGQTIGGAVTKVIGTEAVEVRNQTHGRIVIRIDRIDAIAAY